MFSFLLFYCPGTWRDMTGPNDISSVTAPSTKNVGVHETDDATSWFSQAHLSW